jgi:hypothetical protein
MSICQSFIILPQWSRGFRTSKAKRGRNLANNSVGQLVTPGLPDEGVDEIYGKRADTVIAGTAVPGGGKAVPVRGGYRISGHWQFGSSCREASSLRKRL